MAILHVVAAVWAIDVVIPDDASAQRALVAAPSHEIEKRRRQRHHQQTDDCLPHQTCSERIAAANPVTGKPPRCG
jgi:hypothetical protein